MAELDKEDSAATRILNSQLDPLLKRLNRDPGPSDEEARSIRRQIVQFQKSYCGKLTPHLVMILKDALADLPKLLPDYERAEQISAELNKTQLGKEHGFTSPGLMQLEAVQGYGNKLRGIFKFANYSYSDEE